MSSLKGVALPCQRYVKFFSFFFSLFKTKVHAPVVNDYNANVTMDGSLLRGKRRLAPETAEKFKDLTLHEIIRLLGHHQNDIRANAAGYLQHLSYDNVERKNEVRLAGGIPRLIEVLEERTEDSRIVGEFLN